MCTDVRCKVTLLAPGAEAAAEAAAAEAAEAA